MFKGLWNGFKGLVAETYAFAVKFSKPYKAAPAARGAMITAAKSKGRNAASAVALAIGAPVVGVLGYLGIRWTGDKANDASESIGFLTILAGVTAIGVAAMLVLKRKG